MGILSAALKQGRLDAAGYEAMIASITQLNAVGAKLPATPGAHAVTDGTGFGLLGHALEVRRGSGLGATLRLRDVPLLPGVAGLARDCLKTGAAARNWASYGHDVHLAPDLAAWRRDLLCDPQTSGGLLIAVAPDQADAVLDLVRRHGFMLVAVVGETGAGTACIDVI